MYASRLLFLAICCSPIAMGQEADRVYSGPQSGERLLPLPVVLAYGDDAGRTVDLVQLAGDRPTLLVIVNGANRPAARLTRALMNYAEMQGSREPDTAKQLYAAVVYLDGDRAAALQYLDTAIAWWKVAPPVGVAVDGAEGPGSYGLNRNVNVTILLANKGLVVRNDALVQPSETDAAAILGDVVKLVGGRVPTIAEVTFLTVPTHKLPSAGWRKAPTDVRLRQLICDALSAQDDSSARAAAAAVESYIADDPGRTNDLAAAASILLEGRTRIQGQPIVKHLRRWRNAYDVQEHK